MQETLERLRAGRSIYSLAKAYAAARGETPTRPDHYASAVKRMLKDPDAAEWGNLKTLLEVLGVDAEAALQIAASQIKSTEK